MRLEIIVKELSSWRIDKRAGDYKLPNGAKLSDYLYEIIEDFCEKYNMIIDENGVAYPIMTKIDGGNRWRDSFIGLVEFGENITITRPEFVINMENMAKRMVGR